MTIYYLIKNRERPYFFSKRWFVVWMKRCLHFFGLLQILLVRYICIVRGAKIGDLSIIEGTKIRGNLKNLHVGRETVIAKSVHFALHDKIFIGSNVVINSGVQVLTASHDIKDPKWSMYSRNIIIEDYAWIATNAMILPGVKIGKYAIVGAGAVVRNDVPDGSICIGNPAKVVGMRSSENIDYSPVILCSPYEAWIGH